MNILLDRHIAVWAIIDDPRLSVKARNLLLDPDNTIYFSSVSVHDRLLLSQAKSENYRFMTHDEMIQHFDEKCIIPV